MHPLNFYVTRPLNLAVSFVLFFKYTTRWIFKSIRRHQNQTNGQNSHLCSFLLNLNLLHKKIKNAFRVLLQNMCALSVFLHFLCKQLKTAFYCVTAKLSKELSHKYDRNGRNQMSWPAPMATRFSCFRKKVGVIINKEISGSFISYEILSRTSCRLFKNSQEFTFGA